MQNGPRDTNLRNWHDQHSVQPVVVRAIRVFYLLVAFSSLSGFCADPSDPVLDLLLQKGIVTEAEVQKARADAERIRTNQLANLMPPMESKWKLSKAIQNIELYGDLRLRYEHREASTTDTKRLQLDRGRYALRLGLRGEAFDDFYYGLRLDTAANPRSPWVTFGTSSSGVPYQGPFGKSTAGINVDLIYIGWHPASWVDITVGKMPQPLYTTPMVWDSDFTPEGAAEKFNYQVGDATFFANFGQFLYQDVNPAYSSGGLGFNSFAGQTGDTIFQIAWQGGVNYRFTTNLSAKAGATLYQYMGLRQSTLLHPGPAPYFGDVFIGEGAYAGPDSPLGVGGAGYNLGNVANQGAPTYPSYGYPLNQVGLRHLLILEFPFELNYRMNKLNWRLFGDVSYNLDGAQRAEEAAQGYAAFLANPILFNPSLPASSTLKPFAAQRQDVKAYQIGLGVGSDGVAYGPIQGLVYGASSHKHNWELRTYWQHVEQYALDPNLIDSDFFEGRANLEGIYTALAYSFTDNVIGTFRYGYAWRINRLLGTGGSNQDIPQVNPIDHYSLLQLDFTFRF
jgi:hypothetical protein